jgi:hypothetical protein
MRWIDQAASIGVYEPCMGSGGRDRVVRHQRLIANNEQREYTRAFNIILNPAEPENERVCVVVWPGVQYVLDQTLVVLFANACSTAHGCLHVAHRCQ